MNKFIINKNNITRIKPFEGYDVCESDDSSYYHLHYKGDKIRYLFPRLWRPKYYEHDVYVYRDCYREYKGIDAVIKDLITFWGQSEYKKRYYFKGGHLYKKCGYEIVMANNEKLYLYFRHTKDRNKSMNKLINNPSEWIEIHN